MFRLLGSSRRGLTPSGVGEGLPWTYPYGLLEKIWIGLWSSVLSIGLLLYGHLARADEFVWASLGMLALVSVVPQLTIRLSQRAVHLGRIGISIVSAWTGYERSAQLVGSLRTTSYETQMIAADLWLFGANPSEWTEALLHPVLTEYLQITYVSYFPMMILVGVALLFASKERSFYTYLFAMNLAMITCHLFYFLVPVRSPFFVVDSQPYSSLIEYTVPLEGLWWTETLRHSLLEATSMRHDCFPSGHTMHSILVMYFGWRTHPLLRSALIVIGVSIIFSTIYLRYHYAIDLLVGGAFAVACIWGAHRLAAWGWSREPSPQTGFAERVLSMLKKRPDAGSDGPR